ncbi:unnamed protein product, partial [Mesorhabditis belari]|uniref:CUB domain-containing protein n=1 Tax=Mesorhabditis belari TaxID=2138241 RepID=A0AAF3EW11_9BILA
MRLSLILALVNFTTDGKVAAKGFKAKWSAECGTIFKLDHGVVVSPHYPSYYPNTNSECQYLIDPETDGVKVIVLKIQDLDLSPTHHSPNRYPCDTDYVEISSVENRRVMEKYCATSNGKEFQPISIKGAVGIRFVSNTSYLDLTAKKLRRGFKIAYALNVCGEEINFSNMEGRPKSALIQSPGFPLPHHESLDCWWNVTAPENRTLHIKWEKLELEDSVNCTLDFVEVIDGSSATKNPSSGPLCGLGVPLRTYRTAGNTLFVHFVTDASINHGGFQMIVTSTLGPAQGCGGSKKVTETWQSIQAPVDPSSLKYYDDLRCGWIFKSQPNTKIEFRLTKLDTEENEEIPQKWEGYRKCHDGLTFYDGFPNAAPALATDVCNATTKNLTLPLYYHPSGNVAYVTFESDFGGTGDGFTLEYRSYKMDCGGTLRATTEEQLLAFAEGIEKRGAQEIMRCRWQIEASELLPIELRFTSLKVPDDGTVTGNSTLCDHNFVEIRDIGSLSKCGHPACARSENELRIHRFCESQPKFQMVSLSSAIQVTFDFAILDERQGFDLNFEYQLLDNCNRTVNAKKIKSGRLTSPNYPQPYLHNASCTTNIQTNDDKKIMLVFKSFHLERGRPTWRQGRQGPGRGPTFFFNCMFDSLTLFEPTVINATAGPYCAAQLPPTYLSMGPILSLQLISDESQAMEGYELSYYSVNITTDGRTEKKIYQFSPIYDTEGVVTNVGYPSEYPTNAVQRWEIDPPSGMECTFVLWLLQINMKIVDQQQSCSNDEYLEIKNEADPNSAQKFSRCWNSTLILPAKMTFASSANRNILLTFSSDNTKANDGFGFRMLWECANYVDQRLVHYST